MRKRKAGKTSTKMTKEKKSESKQGLPHIPMDIVRLVMEKIPWKERLRLRLVSKSWKELSDKIQDTEEFLPWVICFDWDKKSDGGTCKLRDPSTQTSYIVMEPTERELFVGAKFHDSRYGWVLFSKEICENFDYLTFTTHIFLYNPFTNEIIKFPKLWTDQTSKLARISLNSGLLYCIVVGLSPGTRKLRVKICHPGDKSWNTFKVNDNMSNDIGDLLDLAYTGKVCYCLFSSGKLGAFDMKQQQWKLLSHQLPKKVLNPFSRGRTRMSVTFSGDLILLSSSRRRARPQILRLRRLWKFDFLRNTWVVAGHEIIEKQVMFIGSEIFCSNSRSLFSVPALGNARASVGKIFYDGWCNDISWGRTEFPWQSKDYGWIEEDNGEHVQKYWIQPPFPNPLRASNYSLQNKN